MTQLSCQQAQQSKQEEARGAWACAKPGSSCRAWCVQGSEMPGLQLGLTPALLGPKIKCERSAVRQRWDEAACLAERKWSDSVLAVGRVLKEAGFSENLWSLAGLHVGLGSGPQTASWELRGRRSTRRTFGYPAEWRKKHKSVLGEGALIPSLKGFSQMEV